MKNEEYEIGYKYGYKLGKYKSSCDISVNFFKMTFGKEFTHERKRIKWLSNYELELLWDQIFEYLRHDNSKNGERKEEEINKYKANILKLLR
jgi:hypothetical protein